MTETGTEDTVSLTEEKRVVKPTLKALEYSLQTKISSRRAILGKLTVKKNELHALMDDDANVEIIANELLAKYETLIKEFRKINADVKDLFCQIECVENLNTDQSDWFEPRNNEHREFVQEVNAWIQNAILRREEANKVSEQIHPEDSVSFTASKSRKSKSVSATSTTSSARAERLKVELERAALLAKSATLRKRQTLEEQELQLKVEKEQLELQSELAATDARLAVLRKYEGSDVSSRTKGSKVEILMSAPRKRDVSQSKRSVASCGTLHCHTSERGADAMQASVTSVNLVTVMQRQNDITESLIKQQRLSTLPSPNIPVFKGDPLEYRLFMRAFEHRIESKTENSKDRLYYLEQHTNGQPNDLVRSCFHMDPDQGYLEAKRLLKERFGDKYKISMAYLDKALNWPVIKADDTKALEAYALFMTNCNNAMSDLEYLEEMENAANMRTIISKLPYRLRERFRSVAIDIQKKQDRRTKFKDVVSFVNTQAEMAAHPVFGEISGQTKRQTERSSGKKNITTLATEVKEQKVQMNRISVARLEDLWTQQFKYDFPENAQGEQLEMSKEDQLFMDRVSKSAKLVNGHYSVGLPLKNKDVKMPNNRAMIEQRALNMKKKLQKNQTFKEDYVSFMNEVIKKGYAVKVPDEELKRSDGKVWFIPHHGVYHPKKHKMRVVFDCGASYQGTTLNEQLLQGPDLTSSLVGVLTRFRQERVAVMADVESMFHQVKVPPEDADLLRFLWWPDGDTSKELQEYRMEVHLFGATSSPSCASYALRRCAEDNKNMFDAAVVDTILNNFYVDDCLRSVATEQEAVRLFQDLKAICQTGGFRLTKWTTNNRNVLLSIPLEDRATEVKDFDLDQDSLAIKRALGVQWCIRSDQFKFHVHIEQKPLTRRGILSIMSSVYDPLGMLSPVILPARNILQELCRQRTGWDETVPEHFAQQWTEWTEELQQLTDFGVDRCFKPPEFGKTMQARLHHFCDACETGYGTVTYLVQKNSSNQILCSFVLGKARVAPLKPPTIPRMELTAAALAVKVDVMLKKELQLPLSDSRFWTDSTAVLKYLANENIRFKTFVANKIAIILQASKVQQWSYVNTQLNPADCASRGQKVSVFMKNEVWIEGPVFLSKPEREWPDKHDHLEELAPEDPEVKKGILVNAITAEESTDAMQQLIQYYSSWIHLKKAVAWLIRLKGTLVNLSRKRKEMNGLYSDQQRVNREMLSYKKNLKQTYLTVDNLRQAETDIIGHCQQSLFHEEISALRRKDSIKKSSRIFRLNPQLEEGILRVGGRLSRASMPAEAKHPIILPKNHRVADLILQDSHERLGHSGRNHVLSHVRQKYWIIDSSSSIRRMLSRCTICRRQHGASGTQMMANLPRNRVVPDEPPFTRTGVDLFGPFHIKRGRSSVKRYGVIFTCLACRAVHIEMATSLETDSFIQALRRLIARRGQVKEMRSDNGTNFVGADHELRKAIKEWNTSQIENSLLQRDIRWLFNPPSGSHHGGVWERIIRSIRKIMGSTLREQNLDEEGLQTFFCECEAILNSRPITMPSNDINDLEALTPQHLLLLKTNPNLPPGLFDKDDTYARKRWRQVQYMSDLFWKRWTKEYLPQLQERQKWNHPSRNFIPGDVVLIVDESAPRGSWLMGRIVKAMEDEHGVVRKVRVKTKTNELERPITKLCLLQEAV
ncbi:uncharacterized protein LOC143724510 [Siphateles boraxobius]|uniref:uncharacterized protein LOC143724510 n=1 Tax=Siphateles boraxobius TaxID=180520 RepID=UPI00406294B6